MPIQPIERPVSLSRRRDEQLTLARRHFGLRQVVDYRLEMRRNDFRLEIRDLHQLGKLRNLLKDWQFANRSREPTTRWANTMTAHFVSDARLQRSPLISCKRLVQTKIPAFVEEGDLLRRQFQGGYDPATVAAAAQVSRSLEHVSQPRRRND